MENLNNQGKRKQQYNDSARFMGYGIIGMVILIVLMTLLVSTLNHTQKIIQ